MKEIKGPKVQLYVNRSRYTQYLTSLDKGTASKVGLSCYVVKVSALCAAKLHATLGKKKEKKAKCMLNGKQMEFSLDIAFNDLLEK